MKQVVLYIVLKKYNEKFYFKGHPTDLSEEEYDRLINEEIKAVNEHFRVLLKGEGNIELYDDPKDKLQLSLIYKAKKEPTEENKKIVEALKIEEGYYLDEEDIDKYEFLRVEEGEEVKEKKIDDDDVLYPDLIEQIFNTNFMSKDECAYIPGTGWNKIHGEIPVVIKKCIF